MGENSSIPAAERVYGKNLARIRGMDQLARAAGQLIQHEIRAWGIEFIQPYCLFCFPF